MLQPIAIRGPRGTLSLSLPVSQSTIFVGANGSGKSRLAIELENRLGSAAHRIAAHRSLSMNPTVPKISARQALTKLRLGNEEALKNIADARQAREIYRWGSKAATTLLADFDSLLQALFAEQANTALGTHNSAHAGTLGKLTQTGFQKLTGIWNRVMPNRALHIAGDDIQVVAPGEGSSVEPYSASEMSDGERAVFYMIGQTLVAEPASVLIFDEPELHVHRAILSRLWDELESSRPDCAFLLITHDLEFAASRPGQKYVLLSYSPAEGWDIHPVPEDTGFSEEVTALILGSRKPILFVEGTGDSLDLAIYRACYPAWTVLPRGSCENVIHAVVSMRRNETLTRVTCSGLVDADDHDDQDRARLAELGVMTLPVAEIENLILLPTVSAAILAGESFTGDALQARLNTLKRAIFEEARKPEVLNDVVLRYSRRRIDRTLKKIDFMEATTPAALAAAYAEKTSALSVTDLAETTRQRLLSTIDAEDLPGLLSIFDRKKTLLSLAALHLKNTKMDAFTSWLTRAMRNPQAGGLHQALRQVLPVVNAA